MVLNATNAAETGTKYHAARCLLEAMNTYYGAGPDGFGGSCVSLYNAREIAKLMSSCIIPDIRKNSPESVWRQFQNPSIGDLEARCREILMNTVSMDEEL